MSECVEKFFIYNNVVKETSNFNMYNFKSGKSLYEVIRVIEGTPLFLDEHLERLFNSAKIMKFNISITKEEIIKRIIDLIKVNNIKEGNIKLVLNYFSNKLQNEEKPYMNGIDNGINTQNNKNEEDFLAYFIKHSYPNKEQYVQGVDTILYHGERNNPNAKVINNEFREKVNEEIKKNNAYEAILVDNNGNITEGSKSNIFMVKGKEVWTSPVESVLPGITREVIIKVCKSLNIETKELKINEKELKDLDGLFVSGTSPKVLPIKSVGEMKFSSMENPIILNIMVAFDEFMKKNIQKFTYC